MMKLKQSLIILLTFILLIITMLMVDGTFFAPSRIKVKETTIEDQRIPLTDKGFKVLYFSDVHFNLYVDENRLQNIVNKINEAKADVVLFGGDLVDNLTNNPLNDVNQTKLVNLLSEIEAPSGKFFVSGHFESDSEYAKTLINQLMVRAEFESVDDRVLKLYFNNEQYINLIGISEGATPATLKEPMALLNPSIYTLAISHKPDRIDLLGKNKADLMISGFTHGGQINFPGFRNVFFAKHPYTKSTQQIDKTRLDISNGVGTTELDFRLFADPEINVYTFKNKK